MHGRKQLSFCLEMCQFGSRLYQFSFLCQYRTVVPSTGVGCTSLAYCNCVNSKLWFQVRVSSVPVSFTVTVSIQDCGSKYGCRVYQCALLALQPNHKAEVNVAVKIMRSAISFPGVSVSPSHHPPPERESGRRERERQRQRQRDRQTGRQTNRQIERWRGDVERELGGGGGGET